MLVPNYKKKYLDEVRPHLMKTFGLSTVMQVPKIEKVTLNIGLGNAKENKKALQAALDELMLITGQKPVITKAKKDVSNFKIRKGFPVGCKVTLRKDYMYEFLERLCAVALPRTRDFRGLSNKSFDGQGNYSFGIKEQIVFAEIDYDKVDSVTGMDVIITTSADNDEISYELLRAMGLPIREKKALTDNDLDKEENG
ncbi:MAG: 50S ribosomal protein L5 [Candidatus Marinimicrobia bacterium]|jgi:large subunit ribosomal protein L5|nr:50S ribosomal protein L5 [Candidatus Neomarinimicrobiota bacterium]